MVGETAKRGASQRQRTELAATVLISAALGAVGPVAGSRLGWLAPVAALPVGLWLCGLWRRLGEEDLPRGLERAFGPWLGKLAQLLYFAWGLFLLAGSALAYLRRAGEILPGTGSEWFFLSSALALCLWLGRGGEETFARTGRLFLLASLAALAFALVLALPAIDWRNLWPPEKSDWQALPGGALLSLSLAGYGIYSLCLPQKGGEGMRTWPWTLWGCAALGWMALTVTGSFGPALAGKTEEPFFLLLQGVEVPGAFRRGEAALMAVLLLADLTLLSLLSRGCRSLWERAAPRGWGWVSYLLVTGAFLGAQALLGRTGGRQLVGQWTPAGNLLFGAAVPALAVLLQKVRETPNGPPIFSGVKTTGKADVGGKSAGKKSQKENQKKC